MQESRDEGPLLEPREIRFDIFEVQYSHEVPCEDSKRCVSSFKRHAVGLRSAALLVHDTG